MNKKIITRYLIAIFMASCLLAGCRMGEKTSVTETDPQTESIVNETGSQFSFADISSLEFWYGSGSGAWRTILYIHKDGTFEGEYTDSNMGNREEYVCNFTGKFTEPVKINDYTYSVKLEQMEYKEEPGTEETIDGIRYIYEIAYGLDDAYELLFYLPGAPVEKLPQGYQNWMRGYGDTIDTQLPFYGLYNIDGETGFSSHT